MSELAIIGSALSSIKTAAEIAKLIKDSGTSLDAAETKLKLAELIEALADAKIEVAELRVLSQEKDQRIAELEKEKDISTKLRWDGTVYWLTINDEEIPHCPKCYDGDGKLVKIHRGSEVGYDCKVCKTYLDDGRSLPHINYPRDDYI